MGLVPVVVVVVVVDGGRVVDVVVGVVVEVVVGVVVGVYGGCVVVVTLRHLDSHEELNPDRTVDRDILPVPIVQPHASQAGIA